MKLSIAEEVCRHLQTVIISRQSANVSFPCV